MNKEARKRIYLTAREIRHVILDIEQETDKEPENLVGILDLLDVCQDKLSALMRFLEKEK